MVLLPLHPSVLEPDFDLSLRQAQRVRDLHPAPARQVSVVVKLLFQLQDLLTRIGRPRPLRLTPRVVRAHCGRTMDTNDRHIEHKRKKNTSKTQQRITIVIIVLHPRGSVVSMRFFVPETVNARCQTSFQVAVLQFANELGARLHLNLGNEEDHTRRAKAATSRRMQGSIRCAIDRLRVKRRWQRDNYVTASDFRLQQI